MSMSESRPDTPGHEEGRLVFHPKGSKRDVFVCIAAIGLGVLLIWIFFDMPASATVAGRIFDFIGPVLGSLFIAAGLVAILGPRWGYPRLILDNNKLISEGMFRSSILDLDKLGKAAVISSGSATFLAFFTLDEERALALRNDFSQPSAFGAAKTFFLSPYTGNDPQRAQKIANLINACRSTPLDRGAMHVAPDIRDSIKKRSRRARLLLILMTTTLAIGLTYLNNSA
ncbi:hypothetical protein [Pararhizobium sp. LjRoot238]|uniref:hypothetical protein n=1 Tax=Pararhizobium sp. LjRoot238 TaxID=3342293 RepID=UPI003ECD1D72